MKQPGEICEEPLCDQVHVWNISTDGLSEWARVRQGPPPAAAPVPFSAVVPVPEPREEEMYVEKTPFPKEMTLQVEKLIVSSKCP